MNLFEWKEKTFEDLKENAKLKLRNDEEGIEFFTEEQLEQFREEIEIEDFSEIVNFEEEFDFEQTFVDPETLVTEVFDFEPNKYGEKMDLFFEVDLSVYEPSFTALGQIRDSLFAEDYEFEVVDEGKMAKVVFKRSGGTISKKKVCGPGMRLVGKRCLPQAGSQKSKERVKGIKLKRAKKAMGAGLKKKAAIKAKITKKRVKGRTRNFSGLND